MRHACWALLLTPACGEIVSGVPLPEPDDTAVEAPDDTAVDDTSTDDTSTDDTSTDDTSTDDTATDDTAVEPEGLAVLSLNLHCLRTDGTPYADNAARFAAIASVVAAEGIEVLAVQEACVAGDVDAMVLLAEALGAATGQPWTGVWERAHVAWQGTPDEAIEGVGLLSSQPLSAPEALTYARQSGLTRVAVAASLPDGTRVVSVHLDYDDPQVRLAQARQTASHFLATADPSLDVVLAGDFNASVGEPAAAAPAGLGFLDASAALDRQRIDHVLVHRGGRWRASSAALRFTGGSEPLVSDHPGVLVHLQAGDPDPVTVTRVTAHIDVGFGHVVSLRGDTAPLSWDRGWVGAPLAADRWGWVLTELNADFAYKVLVDDVTWQTGGDVSGRAGADNEVTPSF